MDRRRFLQATASLPLAVSPVFAQARGHVVVVGGGFGGATAAKYLRTYAPALKVTLVEPGDVFYSCPLSCRVLIGAMGIRELSQSYESFAKRHGVSWVRDLVRSIDAGQRQLLTASGQRISYDRVIVAPGVDYETQIQPLFNARCTRCHGGLGGLQLSSFANLGYDSVTDTLYATNSGTDSRLDEYPFQGAGKSLAGRTIRRRRTGRSSSRSRLAW